MTIPEFGFSTITASGITAGTDESIARAQEILDEAVAAKAERTFENTLLPLDLVNDVLAKAFTRFVFMGYVHPDKDARSAGKAAEEKLGAFGVEMIFRDDLNAAVREYAATGEAAVACSGACGACFAGETPRNVSGGFVWYPYSVSQMRLRPKLTRTSRRSRSRSAIVIDEQLLHFGPHGVSAFGTVG